jgi:hypothetical protein
MMDRLEVGDTVRAVEGDFVGTIVSVDGQHVMVGGNGSKPPALFLASDLTLVEKSVVANDDAI